jgi:hypothetical protein
MCIACAVDSAGTLSQPSGAPMDYATTATALFAENITSVWEIKASHLAELQKAVDAVRTASGLPHLFDSAPSLVGAAVAASHFTSIMDALDGAHGGWNLPPLAPRPGATGVVNASHVTQIKDGVR